MENEQSTGAAGRNQEHGFPEPGRFTGVLFVYAGLFTIVSAVALGGGLPHVVAMIGVGLTFLYFGGKTLRDTRGERFRPIRPSGWLMIVIYGVLTIGMVVYVL